MPADRLLNTVLNAFQGAPDQEQNNKILGSTTSLLTTLSNPLNVTLLTSHLLNAPAIWDRVDGLATSLRIISIYNSAAITICKNERAGHARPFDAYQPRPGGGLGSDEWTKAVVKGLDERSPRWKHMLVLGGVLLGMEGQDRQGLSRSLRNTLEDAMVTAANLALENPSSGGKFGGESIVLALNHTFPLLSDGVRTELNYDALVMIMVLSITSTEGYQDGIFLETIDYDVMPGLGRKLDWSPKSLSFLKLQKLASKPLITSMGPLARLTAHAIENVRNPHRIIEVREHLMIFSERVRKRWQVNKLSEIDPADEKSVLSEDTLQITLPVLWQLLKTAMFSTVIILRAIIGRALVDPLLSSPMHAPTMASHCLLILKELYFISSRLGSNAFSAYTFVNLTSIDILTRYPPSAVRFLQTIYPTKAGQIPTHPLQRNHDLFYLNTAEHFTLCLTPSQSDSLIVTPSTPYLSPDPSHHQIELFEAAHSAMLAVLAAPQNADLTAKILPFYVESLFQAFPKNLSPRQFRFAFKALIQICTPPNPLSKSQPQMAETLLEWINHRALGASPVPLPPSPAQKSQPQPQTQTPEPPLSEQAVLLLTLIDALPSVTLSVLEDWLPITAETLGVIGDRVMREYCKARFWEVLESGMMDVERSAVCVAWWGTKGGRRRVLYAGERDMGDGAEGGVAVEKVRKEKEGGPWMSGGLGGRKGDGSRL